MLNTCTLPLFRSANVCFWKLRKNKSIVKKQKHSELTLVLKGKGKKYEPILRIGLFFQFSQENLSISSEEKQSIKIQSKIIHPVDM